MPIDSKLSELRKKKIEQQLAISKRLNPNLSEQEANKKYGKMTMEELSALPYDTIRLISMVKTEKENSIGCASRLALWAQHILWKMAGSKYGRFHGGKGMGDNFASFIPKSSLQSPVCSYYDYQEKLSKKLDALNRELDCDVTQEADPDSGFDDDGTRRNIMEDNRTSFSTDMDKNAKFDITLPFGYNRNEESEGMSAEMDLLKEEYKEKLVY